MASVAAKQFSGRLTGDGRLEIPESGDAETLTSQKNTGTDWNFSPDQLGISSCNSGKQGLSTNPVKPRRPLWFQLTAIWIYKLFFIVKIMHQNFVYQNSKTFQFTSLYPLSICDKKILQAGRRYGSLTGRDDVIGSHSIIGSMPNQ